MKHKHADLMLEYAKQAQVSEEPWRNWEVSYEGEGVWFDISVQPSWAINKEFRMKNTFNNVNSGVLSIVSISNPNSSVLQIPGPTPVPPV